MIVCHEPQEVTDNVVIHTSLVILAQSMAMLYEILCDLLFHQTISLLQCISLLLVSKTGEKTLPVSTLSPKLTIELRRELLQLNKLDALQ